MSINVEVIGGTPMVQHYVKRVADRQVMISSLTCFYVVSREKKVKDQPSHGLCWSKVV
jgi:hypothetical protein